MRKIARWLVGVVAVLVLLSSLAACSIPTCVRYGPEYTTYIPHTYCAVYGRQGCRAYITTYTPYQTHECLEWRNEG
jgi:hypothetical protein